MQSVCPKHLCVTQSQGEAPGDTPALRAARGGSGGQWDTSPSPQEHHLSALNPPEQLKPVIWEALASKAAGGDPAALGVVWELLMKEPLGAEPQLRQRRRRNRC